MFIQGTGKTPNSPSCSCTFDSVFGIVSGYDFSISVFQVYSLTWFLRRFVSLSITDQANYFVVSRALKWASVS